MKPQPVNKGKGTNLVKEITKVLATQTDLKEKALSDMVSKLFDEDKLLMISRLDSNLSFYTLKHLIILNFYFEYYAEIVLTKTLIQIDKPPYYDIKDTFIKPDLEKVIKKSYKRFINELLMLSISKNGLGRTEILEIIKELRERIKEDEIKEAGGILRRGGL